MCVWLMVYTFVDESVYFLVLVIVQPSAIPTVEPSPQPSSEPTVEVSVVVEQNDMMFIFESDRRARE